MAWCLVKHRNKFTFTFTIFIVFLRRYINSREAKFRGIQEDYIMFHPSVCESGFVFEFIVQVSSQ